VIRLAAVTGLRFAAAAAAAAVVVLIVAAAAPTALGLRSFTVLTGSMRPGLQVGDVVVEELVTPEQLRLGDVVTFSSPDAPRRLITHRVRSVAIRDGVAAVRTRGDANTTGEAWSIGTSQRLGRVVRRVPAIGYVAVYSRRPIARVLLLVLPALMLGGWALRAIWRADRRRDAAPA
jgi:signal peptidase